MSKKIYFVMTNYNTNHLTQLKEILQYFVNIKNRCAGRNQYGMISSYHKDKLYSPTDHYIHDHLSQKGVKEEDYSNVKHTLIVKYLLAVLYDVMHVNAKGNKEDFLKPYQNNPTLNNLPIKLITMTADGVYIYNNKKSPFNKAPGTKNSIRHKHLEKKP
jgi:hypothetical protein